MISFEKIAKKMISTQMALGYDQRTIEHNIKDLIIEMLDKYKLPNAVQMRDDLARSAKKWIKLSAPLYGLYAVKKHILAQGSIIRSSDPANPNHRIHIDVKPMNLTQEEVDKLINVNLEDLEGNNLTLGSSRIDNYQKKVKDAIRELSNTPPESRISANSKMNLFHKAELDVRYNGQMEMLQEAHESGQRLFWISSHSDCSERCQKWQGKLVDIDAPSRGGSFETGEVVDGYKVYSLTDIMNQVDKYGHKNNVINGYNCRHYLIAYQKGSHEPEPFSEGNIEKKRKLNRHKTNLEAKLRKLKAQYEAEKQIDKNLARKTRFKISEFREIYSRFCKNNSLVQENWRF